MPPLLHQKELLTAIKAVTRASCLTQKIFTSLQSANTSSITITKTDKSPVTIADYGSQAIVNAILSSVFPQDPIVGEEDSGELRRNENLRDKVWKLVESTLAEEDVSSGEVERDDIGGRIPNAEEMMNYIDKGSAVGGSTGRIILFIRKTDNRIMDFGSN